MPTAHRGTGETSGPAPTLRVRIATQSSPDIVTTVAAPLRKQVIERLREAILVFSYKPGQRLVERDLCDRFGVSRTVIREALRHLEAEGVVHLVPNHGPVVAQLTADEARALYEVREALESLAARICAERATADEKQQLVRALARVESAYQRGKLADELAAKDAFYDAMFKGAGNMVVASTLRPLHARAQMLRALSLQKPGRVGESLVELRQMAHAIERGDGKAAHDLAAKHVRNAGAAALSNLARDASDQEQHTRPTGTRQTARHARRPADAKAR